MSFSKEYGALFTAIADEGDRIAMRYFRAGDIRVDQKGDGTAVTQADRAVEEMARAKVASSRIVLDVLGEEKGGGDATGPSTSGRPRLIIDPIDGTEEFSRGIPTFGTLLAIEHQGEIVAGMASAPALRTRWWAYRGEGAYRNGQRIGVSSVGSVSEAMVFTTGTGRKLMPEMRTKMRRLADTAKSSRSLGGFWQHMLVAEGSVETALDWTSKPWDLGPLGIIVEEAGGRSTNFVGERTIYTGHFLSTNGKIHDEALRLLQ
jgi:histidinol-phosphatase